MASHENRRWLGSWVGIFTFLGGIGLLIFAFNLAVGIFTRPPSETLNLTPGKTVDFGKTVELFWIVFVRVVMLVLMTAIGGVIASRGIKLYGESAASRSAE